MRIPVKIEAFEGPMDLLLHLIDKNEINIYDIPIFEITEQYLEYINNMEVIDLDIMSEFLVMAATLLNIKSRMLLPKEEEEDSEEDPRVELVNRLIEYKLFKYMSEELQDKQEDASKVVFKHSSLPYEIATYQEEIPVDDLLSDLTLSKLNEIFNSLLKKQVDKIDPVRSKFGKIEREEINLSDKMSEIQEYGILHKRFSFRNLLSCQSSKMELVVSFLCILELIKLGHIEIEQDEHFNDIRITYLPENIIDIQEVDF